jgi:hypothetical protein
MPPNDCAKDRYELIAPVAKGPATRSVIGALIEGLLCGGGLPLPLRYIHQVKDRVTGGVVYEVETEDRLADAEAQRMIRNDLATLSVTDFKDRYSIDK